MLHKIQHATWNSRKCLYKCGLRIPLSTTGPQYNRRNRYSVAFHCAMCFMPLILRWNSNGIHFRSCIIKFESSIFLSYSQLSSFAEIEFVPFRKSKILWVFSLHLSNTDAYNLRQMSTRGLQEVRFQATAIDIYDASRTSVASHLRVQCSIWPCHSGVRPSFTRHIHKYIHTQLSNQYTRPLKGILSQLCIEPLPINGEQQHLPSIAIKMLVFQAPLYFDLYEYITEKREKNIYKNMIIP